MNTNDSEHTEEGLDDVLGALEQLARKLDAQVSPAAAWPAARSRMPRRAMWRWVALASGLAAAACIAVAVILWRQPSPSPPRLVFSGPGPVQPDGGAENASNIMIIDHPDSYSIINMTPQATLITYASKESNDSPATLLILTAQQRPGASNRSGTP